MATDNSQIKQHISVTERNKWDKVVIDFSNHLGAGGIDNHPLGDGSTPGFSTNDYTNNEKNKLATIQEGALNNPHPATHPYTMITGLHQISWTGNFAHLVGIPETFPASGGNADTVGGVRITIDTTAPANPQNSKEIWFDLNNFLIKVYYNDAWISMRGVYA